MDQERIFQKSKYVKIINTTHFSNMHSIWTHLNNTDQNKVSRVRLQANEVTALELHVCALLNGQSSFKHLLTLYTIFTSTQ